MREKLKELSCKIAAKVTCKKAVMKEAAIEKMKDKGLEGPVVALVLIVIGVVLVLIINGPLQSMLSNQTSSTSTRVQSLLSGHN